VRVNEQKKIRWGRVIIASLLAEIVPILILFLVVAVYGLFLTPSELPNDVRLNNFARTAGGWIGPLGGSLVTFIVSLWACRKLRSGHILHGALIGLLSMMMGVGLLLILADRFSLIFVGSYLLRFLSAVGGGYVAQQKKSA
jgi:hypothetical protein